MEQEAGKVETSREVLEHFAALDHQIAPDQRH